MLPLTRLRVRYGAGLALGLLAGCVNGWLIAYVRLPAFVVTLIWQFTSAWNDFLFALFLTNRNNGPVTYALNELAGGQNPDYAQIMAGVLLASLPTLLVYILLGRYFISGLMSGSVK